MLLQVLDDGGQVVMTQTLGSERPFRSGGEGWNVSSKVVLSQKVYQLGCNIIRVGSKDEPGADARKAAAIRTATAKAARAREVTHAKATKSKAPTIDMAPVIDLTPAGGAAFFGKRA